MYEQFLPCQKIVEKPKFMGTGDHSGSTKYLIAQTKNPLISQQTPLSFNDRDPEVAAVLMTGLYTSALHPTTANE